MHAWFSKGSDRAQDAVSVTSRTAHMLGVGVLAPGHRDGFSIRWQQTPWHPQQCPAELTSAELSWLLDENLYFAGTVAVNVMPRGC